MQHLPLDPIIVPYALYDWVKRLSRLQIDSDDVPVRLFLLQDANVLSAFVRGLHGWIRAYLELHNRVLDVEATICGERLGDDEQRLREGLHAHLDAALCALLHGAREVRGARDLERARAGEERLVLERVLDRAQAVAERVLGLLDRVWVGALDEERHALRVLDVLHERELLLAQRVLVHEPGPAEVLWGEVIDRVLRHTAAYKLQTEIGSDQDANRWGERAGLLPFHVTPFRATKGKDAVLGEDIETEGINAFLVDNYEALLGIVPAHLLF